MINRDYHRGYGHAPDRIQMLGVARLVGRSVRCHGRFAAAELIHWSIARTIRAAARHCGTGHRGCRRHAERKQQSDQEYREKAHPHTLPPYSKAGNAPSLKSAYDEAGTNSLTASRAWVTSAFMGAAGHFARGNRRVAGLWSRQNLQPGGRAEVGSGRRDARHHR